MTNVIGKSHILYVKKVFFMNKFNILSGKKSSQCSRHKTKLTKYVYIFSNVKCEPYFHYIIYWITL